MGRWAQASRTGGGPTALNSIRKIVNIGGATATAEYYQPIGAGAFAAGNFESNPSSAVSLSVSQTADQTVAILFDSSIAGDTSIVYSGSIPNILTPQTISY